MKKPEFQKIRIKIVISNLQVFGIITVPINGYRSRLSDLLNNNQDFLALTDVQIYEGEKLIEETPFMCINKHAVMFLSEIHASQESGNEGDESTAEIEYDGNHLVQAIA